MTAEPARLAASTSGPRMPQPPQHLSAAARRFWRQVTGEYVLERHHLAILQAVCEAMDRQTEARAAIESDGAYIDGRFGMKAHPALAVERDSRIALLRGIRELGLDLEQPAQPRPPSRWHS